MRYNALYAPHRANEDPATLRRIKKPALSNRLQILDGGMYETRTHNLRHDSTNLGVELQFSMFICVVFLQVA